MKSGNGAGFAPGLGLATVAPPGEEVGREHEDGELRQLRRLEAQRPVAQPAAGPVHLDAEAGHEHEATMLEDVT